ncbi:Acetyltransferase (GNAT) family [seawater metagenome]|uniref:Acetyltransferase (GNAT) family n=1 Tax=seawater metagenome TaxID=1561972 RepID=A0A5E8CJB7_9ZZZZ
MYPFLNYYTPQVSKKIIIKEAKISNIRQIYSCNKKCLPISYNLESYFNFILSDDSIVLIAERNSELIGYIIGTYHQSIKGFHIISFAVYPKFRRLKIGSKLMANIIKLAINKYDHLKKISLYASCHNYIGHQFYLGQGFCIVKIIKNYYSHSDNAFVFEKTLN